nr:MAG TPA: hypothetical protein [Bacteriophage sp.]
MTSEVRKNYGRYNLAEGKEAVKSDEGKQTSGRP